MTVRQERRIRAAFACVLAAFGCGRVPAPRSTGLHEGPSSPAAPLPESFGTPDPFTLLAFDPERRWVAMCQARKDTDGDGITRVGFEHHGRSDGDEMRPYFIDGGGAGEPIREFLEADPFGHWVALRRSDRIELVDTRSHTARDLSMVDLDEERDPEPRVVRTLRFSPAGNELLLLKRHAGNEAEVLVMSLYSGKMRMVDFGAGRVWRARFSRDGRWLYADVVRKDINGNGTLDLPRVVTTLDSDPCGQPLSYSMLGYERNDELESVIVPLDGGPMRGVEGIQGHLERDLVRRLDDGTLVRESASGSQSVLSPASCGGNLDYYSLENGRWLVGCYAPDERPTVADADPPKPSHVWLFGRGVPEGGKDLGIEVKNGVEEGRFGTKRFSYLNAREKTVYFDLKRNVAITEPEGMHACGRHGDTFMLETNDDETPTTYLWDPGSPPTAVAQGDCWRFGEEHMGIGYEAFSWEKRAIVGDLASLCHDGKCGTVEFRPVLDSGYVLLPQRSEPGLDVPGLEKTLRTSLANIGEYGLADTGPLAWKTWTAPRPGSSRRVASQKRPEEPSRSCEILKASVSVQTSAGPLTRLPLQGGAALESYMDRLDPEDRRACDDAYGGRCPEIGLVTAPMSDGTWEAMYQMALDLAAAPREKSPLGGILVDTPLRKDHGKIAATLRAWGDGRVYESTATDLAKVSFGWQGAAKADGTQLALRGFVGWLNGVAEARGDPRRFAWVDGYPRGVVIMKPDDLCKLTRGGVVRATVGPSEEFTKF